MDVKIICLTPIKNEEWILDNFLSASEEWADKIILADQFSTDKSKEIAEKHKKAVVIDNKSLEFNEPERQKLLIDESRKYFPKSKHILLALDADEFLCLPKNFDEELEVIKNLPAGTVIKFRWENVRLSDNKYWESKEPMSFGFVDDGSEHKGAKIHSPRIPIPANANTYVCRFIKVMHYQYADWRRMESKHRWYQCWEKINNPEKSFVDIYRQYHHMYAIKKRDLKSIPNGWYLGYQKKGINLNNLKEENVYWWDKAVTGLFDKYGIRMFSAIDIWGFDWSKINSKYSDPRSILIKGLQGYLRLTQAWIEYLPVKVVDKLIKIVEKNVKK